MKEYYQLLEGSQLFMGIKRAELKLLLDCLQGNKKHYDKGQWIYLEGEEADKIGIFLSGKGQVVREDGLGNRVIVSALLPGDLFGEAYACARIKELPVSVLAVAEAEVLFIDYGRIVSSCPSACRFHRLVIENMLRILAEKNIYLNRKMGILSRRSTREKLMAYLSLEAGGLKEVPFYISFNRQELADYLCVERSAMCGELGRMKKDGLIDYHKDIFRIL